MRLCLMVEGQEGVRWDQWLALAEVCERVGLEGLFTSDHYLSVHGFDERGSFDVWTVLAGLAAHTRRIRLGTLVSPVGFRHPSVLARQALALDHISGGRVEIGLGAGWMGREHERHGFSFPATAVRLDRLAEQLAIVDGLLTDPSFSCAGVHYSLGVGTFLPRPIQRPRPPIIVGGSGGPRQAELVARFADEFNTPYPSPDECRERFARVRAAVAMAGRPQRSLTTSIMTGYIVGRDESEVRARAAQVAAWMGRDGHGVDAFLESVEAAWVVGTPDRAATKLAAFAAAGVQRVMLQHHLNDDLELVELVATDVAARLAPPLVEVA